MREAGCTAAQEMALRGRQRDRLRRGGTERGVDVDEFAPRLSWIFNTHMDFFEEIAKYRALRRLWAHVMRDRFGAQDPRSMMLRTHTQTAGSTLTLQQPENNIVRAAVQALAAALGGVQSMALSCFDEAIAIPTEHAQTLAVRTQQMLQHEFGITGVADPLGGSWHVEQLTDGSRRRPGALIAQIDSLGGAVAAIEQGFYQRLICRRGLRARAAHRPGEDVVVGVNAFVDDDRGAAGAVRRAAPARRASSAAGSSGCGPSATAAPCEAALAALAAAAAGEGNLMPAIVAAVRAERRWARSARALRGVFGEYRPASAAQI